MLKKENTMLKKVSMVLLLPLMLLFVVSCQKSNGGGFIDSVTGTGKATFGVQMKCDNILHTSGQYVGKLSGNLQFNDHTAGVKIHGDIDFIPNDYDSSLTSCEMMSSYFDGPLGESISFAAGTYTSQPGNKAGEFVIGLLDNDPNFTSCPDGDAIEIMIGGDISYSNGGCLRGGNMSIF